MLQDSKTNRFQSKELLLTVKKEDRTKVSTISKVTIDLANFTQHNAQTTHTFGLKKQGASIKFSVKCEWKRYNKKKLVQKTAGAGAKSVIAIDGAEFELNTDNELTDDSCVESDYESESDGFEDDGDPFSPPALKKSVSISIVEPSPSPSAYSSQSPSASTSTSSSSSSASSRQVVMMSESPPKSSSSTSSGPSAISFAAHLHPERGGGGSGGGGGGGGRFQGKRDSLMLYNQPSAIVPGGGGGGGGAGGDKITSASRKEVQRLQKKTEGLERENDKLQVIINNQTRELKELRQQLEQKAKEATPVIAATASPASSKDGGEDVNKSASGDAAAESSSKRRAGRSGGSSASKSKKRSKSGTDSKQAQERELLEACVYSAIAQWQLEDVDKDLYVIALPAKDSDAPTSEAKFLTLAPTNPSDSAQQLFRNLLSWGLFADTSSDSFMKKFLRAIAIEHSKAKGSPRSLAFWLSMLCSLLNTMQSEKNLNTRGDLVMSGLNPELLTKATASSSSSSLDDDENGRVQWFEQKLEILACKILISIMSHYQQMLQDVIEFISVQPKFPFMMNASRVTTLLEQLLSYLEESAAPRAVLQQAGHHFYHTLDAILFNKAISTPGICQSSTGMAIKLALSQFETWNTSKGLPHESLAQCMVSSSQMANILVTAANPAIFASKEFITSQFSAVRAAQLLRLLENATSDKLPAEVQAVLQTLCREANESPAPKGDVSSLLLQQQVLWVERD